MEENNKKTEKDLEKSIRDSLIKGGIPILDVPRAEADPEITKALEAIQLQDLLHDPYIDELVKQICETEEKHKEGGQICTHP